MPRELNAATAVTHATSVATERSAGRGAGWTLAAVLVVALGMLAPWIAEPRDGLVSHTLTEDAFYYFQTARSVAHGEGSVSSGGIPTNSYHPLWMVVSAAAFWLAPATPAGDLAAIRFLLCLGAVLFVLSAWVLWRVLRALGVRPWPAVFAAACYVLNPWAQELAIGGMEAPANALLIGLFVWWFVGALGGSDCDSAPRDLVEPLQGSGLLSCRTQGSLVRGRGTEGASTATRLSSRAPSTRQPWALLCNPFGVSASRVFGGSVSWACGGLLTGLVYLVRTDNVFLLAASWAFVAWRIWRERGAWRIRRERGVRREDERCGESAAESERGGWRGSGGWHGLAAAGAVAAVTVAPWVVWNALRFGALMQGSASALPVVRRLVFFAEHPGATAWDFTRYRLGLFSDWFGSVLWFSGLGLYLKWLCSLAAAVVLGGVVRLYSKWLYSLVVTVVLGGVVRRQVWDAPTAPKAAQSGASAAMTPAGTASAATVPIASAVAASAGSGSTASTASASTASTAAPSFWACLLTESFRDFGRKLMLLLPLFVAVVCLGFAHKFVRLATREWYYVTSDVLIALVVGVTADFLARAVRGPHWPRVAIALLVVALAFPAFGKLAYATFAHGSQVSWHERVARPPAYTLEIANAIDRLPGLAPGEPVGVTDSGTVGFFASHPVVNLDGVVNPEAARAIVAGRLLDYVRSKGIRYVVVTPRMQRDVFWGASFAQALEPWPALTGEGFRVRETGRGAKDE